MLDYFGNTTPSVALSQEKYFMENGYEQKVLYVPVTNFESPEEPQFIKRRKIEMKKMEARKLAHEYDEAIQMANAGKAKRMQELKELKQENIKALQPKFSFIKAFKEFLKV